jgi:hypothetical protein
MRRVRGVGKHDPLIDLFSLVVPILSSRFSPKLEKLLPEVWGYVG